MPALSSLIDQLPIVLRNDLVRVALAIGAFALIWLLRNLIIRISRKLLQRLRVMNRLPVEVAVRDILARPVRILTLALALDISIRILNPESLVLQFVFRFTRSLVIIALALLIYGLISVLTQSRARLYSLTGVRVEDALLPFVRTGLRLILISIGLIFVLHAWGYEVTGLIAGLGLGGLAVSLAAQETISNLFGFSMIVTDRPFVVGEFIKTPDVEGVVERVGLRSTSVRQLDQAVVTIPNARLAAAPILNWSRLSKRWINFTLRINYGATPDQIELLLERIRAMLYDRDAVDTSSVVVQFIDFGENSLHILVRAYVNLPNWLEFTQERERINLAVMRIIDEIGLSIAYPSRSVYIEKLPAGIQPLSSGGPVAGASGFGPGDHDQE